MVSAYAHTLTGLFLALTLLSGSYICAVLIYTPRQKFEFLYWIYVFIFIVLPLYGTLFPTADFSHRVYRRGFNEAIGTLCFPFFHPLWHSFIFILYGVSLCRSVLLACLLARSAARGEVLQYLSHSALSHVESYHIRVFRLSLFLPFSLRQDNTHKTSSFHQTSIIILTIRIAISHLFSYVMCRITSYRCIQTFHFSCLSREDKTIHTRLHRSIKLPS